MLKYTSTTANVSLIQWHKDLILLQRSHSPPLPPLVALPSRCFWSREHAHCPKKKDNPTTKETQLISLFYWADRGRQKKIKNGEGRRCWTPALPPQGGWVERGEGSIPFRGADKLIAKAVAELTGHGNLNYVHHISLKYPNSLELWCSSARLFSNVIFYFF